MGEKIGENISKKLSGKHSACILAMRQKIFDHAKQSATNVLKTSSKRVILLVIKLLIKFQKFQKIDNKIIPKQLQMRMIKKYLKKDIKRKKES